MPLIALPGQQAVANRKTNPWTYWGSRSSDNRVEPVALPEFHPGFTLQPGEQIFTIGSCFARHVEDELMKRGFRTPVREIMKQPLFADLETGVLNNYGTPSIYNELAWAFDADRPFVPAEHLLEVKPGKFVDIHLPPTLAPADWDTVVARRQAIRELMRISAQCRVIVITLGLAEVWFDTATGYYLNDTVRPALLRMHPSRFELHVLSYEEAYRYLEQSLGLLKKYGREDLRVVLTVSPVPMDATHRPMDVIVANTYSKSVLRAVAEAVVCKYDWIDYYPSYESVMLSDRSLAWEADLIHVTGELVALNVSRMLERYVPSAGDWESLKAQIDTGGPLVAHQLARAANEKGSEFAKKFFTEFGSWSARSADFALEHAKLLYDLKDDAGVIEVLTHAPRIRHPKLWEFWQPKNGNPYAAAQIHGQALLRLGRAAEAVALLEPLTKHKPRSQETWELLVRAYAENNDPEGAISTTHRFLSTMGYAKSWAFLNLARALKANHPSHATHFYEAIVEEFLDGDPWIQFEIADFLAQQGKFEACRRMLAHIQPTHADLQEKVAMLLTLLAGAPSGRA